MTQRLANRTDDPSGFEPGELYFLSTWLLIAAVAFAVSVVLCVRDVRTTRRQ